MLAKRIQEFIKQEVAGWVKNPRQCAALYSLDWPAEARLLQTLISGGSSDEAGKRSRDILREDPENPRAWYVLGRVQTRQGDHAEAARSNAFQKVAGTAGGFFFSVPDT